MMLYSERLQAVYMRFKIGKLHWNYSGNHHMRYAVCLIQLYSHYALTQMYLGCPSDCDCLFFTAVNWISRCT